MHTVQLIPTSKAFTRNLKELGYDTGTALADLIDNSIAAGASEVRISIGNVDGEAVIELLDNGNGMNEETLVYRAMKFDCLINETREKNDLGRFGLGLKTASASMGRRFMVITKQSGCFNSAEWDFDRIEGANDWGLLVNEKFPETPASKELRNSDTGTLVRVSKLYGFGDTRPKSTLPTDLAEEMKLAEHHLATIFHRFIEGGNLKILMGKKELKPINPIHDEHEHTQFVEEITVGKERHKIQGYVISPDIDVPDTDQGIYIYRADRLISIAGWHGFKGPKNYDELSRLARVVINVDQESDAHWDLNIKKSTVKIPRELHTSVKNYCAKIQAQSKAILTFRLSNSRQRESSPNGTDLWVPTGKMLNPWAIDRKHALLADILKGSSKKDVLNALLILEKNAPSFALNTAQMESELQNIKPQQETNIPHDGNDEVDIMDGIPHEKRGRITELVKMLIKRKQNPEQVVESLTKQLKLTVNIDQVHAMIGAE